MRMTTIVNKIFLSKLTTIVNRTKYINKSYQCPLTHGLTVSTLLEVHTTYHM